MSRRRRRLTCLPSCLIHALLSVSVSLSRSNPGGLARLDFRPPERPRRSHVSDIWTLRISENASLLLAPAAGNGVEWHGMAYERSGGLFSCCMQANPFSFPFPLPFRVYTPAQASAPAPSCYNPSGLGILGTKARYKSGTGQCSTAAVLRPSLLQSLGPRFS